MITKILKTYPNGKTYDSNSITISVDGIPYCTVQKHLYGAKIIELKQQGITNNRITKKYTFNEKK